MHNGCQYLWVLACRLEREGLSVKAEFLASAGVGTPISCAGESVEFEELLESAGGGASQVVRDLALGVRHRGRDWRASWEGD